MAKYPAYQQVMPKDSPSSKLFDRKIFAAQVKRLIPSTTKRAPEIKITNIGDKTLLQTTNGALAWLPFSLADFSAPGVLLNAHYLYSALACDKSPLGYLACNPGDLESPIALTINNFTHVIVPMAQPKDTEENANV
jgi:DNA polymerase III sliding clamp (beta) subunit (PCNA family)